MRSTTALIGLIDIRDAVFILVTSTRPATSIFVLVSLGAMSKTLGTEFVLLRWGAGGHIEFTDGRRVSIINTDVAELPRTRAIRPAMGTR